ncbi:hypothetical protein GOP47_0007581 [Adiantum capillus-veneris]|uniref:Uncharacterized protein n=1 Tax=Adiantum capillus-veneris TaxID=13818 RepID=A0A9D4V2G0_ADICA|nr:hypothetical protein GOP47_0007581 [Adiantum capillus-veneris]
MAVSSLQVVYQLTADLRPFIPQRDIKNQLDLRTNQGGATRNCGLLWPYQSCRPKERRHHSRLVAASDAPDAFYDDLRAGSPIMIIEAPLHLKTAEPMPMLRQNNGFVMPGDAGRIISRRPKDVWAIRFKSGAFLIERRYFKPLDAE